MLFRPKSLLLAALGVVLATGCASVGNKPKVRLMTLEPAHFHAALVQKEMQPDVAPEVDVYAEGGADLSAHLNRIAAYNSRQQNPTYWEERVRICENPLQQMLKERRGNVVVMSGKNAGKIEKLKAIVEHRLNVLADKPWIIEASELPALAASLDAADKKKVIAFDGMTQRFEVSCQLPRELVNDPLVFGEMLAGTPEQPTVEMESVHYLLKEVSGAPLIRPAWFFDVHQLGEGLADVGTHLVDLVQWTLFPDQAIDYRKDISVLSGTHWPTVLNLEQFQKVTGENEFPESVENVVHDSKLDFFANNTVTYRLRNALVKLTMKWDYEAPAGGKDTELAIFRGSKSRIEVRQGREENFVPEVFVIPNSDAEKGELRAALERKMASLQSKYPGVALQEAANGFRITIPAALRIGHEAHFALLTRTFLDYVHDPKSLPAWEKPNMLAKYYVTTEGVRLARQTPISSK